MNMRTSSICAAAAKIIAKLAMHVVLQEAPYPLDRSGRDGTVLGETRRTLLPNGLQLVSQRTFLMARSIVGPPSALEPCHWTIDLKPVSSE